MNTIAIIFTLFCCLMMFFVKRQTKAAIFIVGAMILTLVNVPGIPLHRANYLIPASFLLSELHHIRLYIESFWKTTYLKCSILIVTISSVICVLTSPHLLTPFSEGFVFLRSELLLKYFAICYAFWAYSSETSIRQTLKLSLYCLIVLTFFGILNAISGSSYFVNELTKGMTNIHKGNVDFGDVYMDSDRFRVLSMFKNPFDYGYICCAIFMLHLHCFHRRIEKKLHFRIATICCLFGIVSCWCRIVWISFAIALSCYYLWTSKLNKMLAITFASILLIPLFYYTLPFVQERIDSITDIFIEDSETAGSSMAMRMEQYNATLENIDEGKIAFGMGHGFFIIDLGWGDNERVDERLQGLESVVFGYLLERGIVGLALWAAFYILIFSYLKQNRSNYKSITGLGVSFLVLYLIFAIGTGELLSVYPTMLLLGYVFKAIEYDKLRRV